MTPVSPSSPPRHQASRDRLARLTRQPDDLGSLAGRFALWRRRRSGGFGGRGEPLEPLWIAVDSLRSHRELATILHGEELHRRAVEASLASGDGEFHVPGYCWVCARFSQLHVDYSYLIEGVDKPNWREHLRCPSCRLNNRMRAAVHFLESALVVPASSPAIYMTEHCTPIFNAMSRRYTNLEGSEFFGDEIPLGRANELGYRNEDLERLTYPSESFDIVMSLDVLEHVPHIERALAECQRVLRPGGTLLFSVPFYPERETNQVRATVDEAGVLTHHLPPEFHGDPLSNDGCLAYHRFGWQLLDQARAAGFEHATAIEFWSRGHGYLGRFNTLFVARRSDR